MASLKTWAMGLLMLSATGVLGQNKILPQKVPAEGLPDTTHHQKMGLIYTGFNLDRVEFVPMHRFDKLVRMDYEMKGNDSTTKVKYSEFSRYSPERHQWETLGETIEAIDGNMVAIYHNDYGDSRVYGDAQNTNAVGDVPDVSQLVGKIVEIKGFSDRRYPNEERQKHIGENKSMLDETLRMVANPEHFKENVKQLIDDLKQGKKMVMKGLKTKVPLLPEDMLFRHENGSPTLPPKADQFNFERH